ncbi:MAG: 4-hydroxy-tetrahydrodipicolinate reductase [bacterium]|nr:4-hydroxy-tetrahydrodipicolinate reductase [bacterium]
MKIPIVISGAAGRMGRAVILAARKDRELEIAGALEYPGHPHLGQSLAEVHKDPDLPRILLSSDPGALLRRRAVWIEFSDAKASLAHLRLVARRGYPMVIGTTGLSAAEKEEVKKLSRKSPVIHSANMSFAVNVLFHLVGEAARLLGPDYQTEILEIHHNQKKDAPSGTALTLAEAVARARKCPARDLLVFDRSPKKEKRSAKEIGVSALRIGDVVGEHTVFFGIEGERLELTHRASSRDIFARGAVRAAKLLYRKKPGLYSLQELLVTA